MRSLASLLFVCIAINAFALRVSQQSISEQTTASNAATSVLPSITFSSIGAVSTVQMTGTATWTYGSDQQTGAVTLQANANGQSRMLLQMPSGPRVETQNSFGDATRQCTWNGFDGVAHNAATHQCWLDTVWFLPQITMQAGAGALDDIAAAPVSVDAETVRFHHERHPIDASDTQTAKLLAHLSAVDLFVDTGTGLPRALQFSGHPDGDAGVDIPIEIRYSDYRVTNGVSVPFHIQKFINQSLVLDLQVSTVQVQLGAAAAGVTPSSLQ
jgi:hypothetical protein